jgi:hypothetical protein
MRVGKSPYETERSERSYNNYQWHTKMTVIPLQAG